MNQIWRYIVKTLKRYHGEKPPRGVGIAVEDVRAQGKADRLEAPSYFGEIAIRRLPPDNAG